MNHKIFEISENSTNKFIKPFNLFHFVYISDYQKQKNIKICIFKKSDKLLDKKNKNNSKHEKILDTPIDIHLGIHYDGPGGVRFWGYWFRRYDRIRLRLRFRFRLVVFRRWWVRFRMYWLEFSLWGVQVTLCCWQWPAIVVVYWLLLLLDSFSILYTHTLRGNKYILLSSATFLLVSIHRISIILDIFIGAGVIYGIPSIIQIYTLCIFDGRWWGGIIQKYSTIFITTLTGVWSLGDGNFLVALTHQFFYYLIFIIYWMLP